MPRELRPRKWRPRYADVKTADHVDEEGTSGSEYEPDKPPKSSKQVPSSDEVEVVEHPESEVLEEAPKQGPATSVAATWRATTRSFAVSPRVQKRKLPPKVHLPTRPPPMASPPLSTPRAAKTYALPNPSAHHRHRAIPVFFRKEMVERLDEPPSLFEEPHTVPTNSMTADRSLTDRVSKAWGFNVGAGPVWQIMEDRSCYKESAIRGPGPEKESSRRPRAYQHVSVRPGWELLRDQCVPHGWLYDLYSSRFKTQLTGML